MYVSRPELTTLALANYNCRLPGTEMRFAHVSDFHFTNSPQDSPVVRNDVIEAIDTLVADLLSIENYLDFIAITGCMLAGFWPRRVVSGTYGL